MANNAPNLGSFGDAIGGSSAIAQAMARRGMDASILQQLSPAAPGFVGMPQTPPPTQNALPPSVPMPAQSSSVQPTASTSPINQPQDMDPGSAEAQLILQALIERLKHHSTMEKSLTRGE